MKKRFISIILSVLLLGNMAVFANTNYTDINESDHFWDEVMFATEKGVINGTDNNQFKPKDTLTIAEAIKISACINANFYEKEITPYDNSTHWVDAYYDYAIQNGIIKEGDFAKVDFDTPITKDRLFFIFANTLPDSEYIVLNDPESSPQTPMAAYVEKLFCAGIITGNENGLELENHIVREECVILISRMMAYSRRQIVTE